MAATIEIDKKNSYKMFDQIAGTYDFLNHVLSLGIDKLWRKKMLSFLPTKKDLMALDIATGTGDVAVSLASSKRIKQIVGMDLSTGMLEVGKSKVEKLNLQDKITFEVGDGVTIPRASDSFDVVTLSFGIRNFPDAQTSLKNIYRVLKPNGRCMIMELSMPKNFIMNAVYKMYFRLVLPFIGKFFSSHKTAYKYLNVTVEDFPSGDEFLTMLKKENFQNLKAIPLTFGIATLYIGDKS